MNRVLGFIIIAAGVAFIIYGIRASESFSSDLSRFFTGSPTDKTIWLTLGGIALTGLGLAAVFVKTK